MNETALPQWEAVDLPLLTGIVEAYDRSGPFALTQSIFRFAEAWSPRDFAFTAKRLADTGYLDVQYGPGGFVRYVKSVSEQARAVATRSPGHRTGPPAPTLDTMSAPLQHLLTQVTQALQAEPSHPRAAQWRALLAAGAEIGTGSTGELSPTPTALHRG
ncbi:hypothetical protein GCM10009830_01060 [Glycomyces endophyticus]|uniref:Uncharacterized protein n=1 Tax=Glycomyces endophyticus TaxID=480996 RepID=A0ABP4RSX8_9ACTN